MKSSRANAQLNLPPGLLPNSSQPTSSRAISSQHEPVRTICSQEPETLSAQLLHRALDDAGLTSYEVAQLVGVSESLVNRWRSPHHRECPSFVQLLKLPPSFQFQLHRALNRHYGFGRQLLVRVLDDLGAIGLAVGE
jgi:DNA-binding transcriptional regulator YiaG